MLVDSKMDSRRTTGIGFVLCILATKNDDSLIHLYPIQAVAVVFFGERNKK